MKNGNYEYKLLYSGQLSPIARLNDEDRVVEEYVYGSRVNVPEYMIKDGRKYRFITDHRGSVRMVVDTHDGNIMQRTDYDEFGLIIDEDLAENWTPVLFGYAGGLQDRDTGLIRFGARDYDPMVGRWTSKEPLGFNGSSNFYVYANNDPVNFVDINGLKPGDYFKTMDDAARDAAEYTLANRNDSALYEYMAEIYEVTRTVNGKDILCYKYIDPYRDLQENPYHVAFQGKVKIEDGLVAVWHSHIVNENTGTKGAYDYSGLSEEEPPSRSALTDTGIAYGIHSRRGDKTGLIFMSVFKTEKGKSTQIAYHAAKWGWLYGGVFTE